MASPGLDDTPWEDSWSGKNPIVVYELRRPTKVAPRGELPDLRNEPHALGKSRAVPGGIRVRLDKQVRIQKVIDETPWAHGLR